MATGLTDLLSALQTEGADPLYRKMRTYPWARKTCGMAAQHQGYVTHLGRGHRVDDTVGQEMYLKPHLMLLMLVYSSKPPKENQMRGSVGSL